MPHDRRGSWEQGWLVEDTVVRLRPHGPAARDISFRLPFFYKEARLCDTWLEQQAELFESLHVANCLRAMPPEATQAPCCELGGGSPGSNSSRNLYGNVRRIL